MSSTKAFEDAYLNLNEEQKAAVDAVYGPVMVIAGPGTGKTQIIAVRIANILQKVTGAKPDEILALTFTESATHSLRTRLTSLMGASAYRVCIHTFHGFAKSILDMRPDLFPRVAYGKQLTEVSGITLIESLLDQGEYVRIRSVRDPYRAAKQLRDFIGDLKSERYTPESYREQLTEALENILNDPDRIHATGKYEGKEKGDYTRRRERLEKHIEVADLYRAYEEALEEQKLYDYEDLISEAIRGLESDEGFRSEVGERFQFVLADEHQDSNPAQNKLLELITDFDGSPNLCIVGDEKQAIYRFQGATLHSFLYFKDKYPDATVITLTKNYRSTKEILATAHDLIAPAPIPDQSLRKKLEAVLGDGVRVLVSSAGTPQEEMSHIYSYIQKLKNKGVPYTDIAILVRKNAEVLALASYFRSQGIPEDHVTAEISALSHPAIIAFLSLIRATLKLSEDAYLARALFLPGIRGSFKERMDLLSSSKNGGTLYDVIKAKGSKELQEWLTNIEQLGSEASVTPLNVWITMLARRSGFLESILSMQESEEAYEAYEGLMQEAFLVGNENYSATASDFLEHIRRIEQHELSVKRSRTARHGVSIMTAHRAKGLEFPYVVIAGVSDENWMRGRVKEFSLFVEQEEDEHEMRRLLYVALTRAKKEALITYSTQTAEGRTRSPLRFLSDIEVHTDTASFESNVPVVPVVSPRTVIDPAFLKNRLEIQGFSPTGFNNYVQSPWQYFFRTLLCIPDVSSVPMLYGTAIHAGLKAYADSKERDETVAIKEFENCIARLPLSDTTRRGLIDQGRQALHTYLSNCGAGIKNITASEYKIEVPFSVPGVGDIRLSGRLDRIDLLPDGTVSVIDYKTGVARSENEIRGKTKDSTGDYYRQLVFYKLLIQKEGKYTMSEAALHFVEPDDAGKNVIRSFSIPDEEVKELEKQIGEAARHILDGSAFREPCDSETCDYADLANLLMNQSPSTSRQ